MKICLFIQNISVLYLSKNLYLSLLNNLGFDVNSKKSIVGFNTTFLSAMSEYKYCIWGISQCRTIFTEKFTF